MGQYDSIEISSSGLAAERLAMDVIANNIANANTTRTPEGGAFKRQLVVFAQKPGASPSDSDDVTGSAGAAGATDTDDFDDDDSDFSPNSATKASVEGVEAVGIVNDNSPDRLVFDPGNPDADGRGYVHYPNVEIVKEMVDMMAASRAYEANVSAIQETRNMGNSDLSLLRS